MVFDIDVEKPTKEESNRLINETAEVTAKIRKLLEVAVNDAGLPGFGIKEVAYRCI